MSNYCPLPFYHTAIKTSGHYTVCCLHTVPEEFKKGIADESLNEWFNSEYVDGVRDAFRNDEKHPGCQVCWDKEAQGLNSYRMRSFDDYKYIRQDQKLVSVELQAGNLCNLSCLMCHPGSSSKVLQEEVTVTGIDIDKKQYSVSNKNWNDLERVFSNTDIRMLNIRGGEPFYNKKLLDVIKRIPDKQAKNMLLHITTNATVFDKEWQEALLRFKIVRYMLSIDAVGEVYEYIRYPANWSAVEKNIDVICSQANAKVLVNAAVQNLNILHIGDLIKWAKEKELHLQLIPVLNKPQLDINVLTPDLYKQAIDKLTALGKPVEEYLEYLKQNPAANWDKFLEFIEPRDRLRGSNYRTVLPDSTEPL